jgi:hypothetical protein
MVRRVAFSYLCTLYVDLDNTEATDEIGIDAVDADAVDGFVTDNGLAVEVADIGNVAVGFYQVNIRVAVYYYEAFGLLAPADVLDIHIAHAVYLVVGIDALIVLVILIECA